MRLPSPTVKRLLRPPLATAAATSPAKASSEPTERSMPAVRMTKVMPTASRPVIDTCRMTLNRLIGERKRGSTMANSRHQHDEEDQRREAGEEAEDVEALSPALDRCRRVGHVRLLRHAQRRLRARASSSPSGFPASPRRAAISPVTRPSRMVTIRSLIASISGSSDEMAMTAMPASRHLEQQVVHLDLGADVDAARRLVDDQHLRAGAPASAPAPPSAGCRRRGCRRAARARPCGC